MKNDALSKEETAQMNEMRKLDAQPVVETEESKPEPKEEVVIQVDHEVKPEIKEDEEKKNKRSTQVPLAKYEEEREARKEAEKRAREFELAQAKAEERMKLINEAIANQQKAKEPVKTMPDPDKDALGALKYNMEEIEALKKYKAERDAQDALQRQHREVVDLAQRSEAEFIKSNSDYMDAGKYLMESRKRELIAQGLDENLASVQVEKEKLDLAYAARQQNKPFAEMVYALSKVRGYSKSNGVATQAQPISDDAKIDMIAQGQKANMSLSNVGGTSANTSPLTAKQLANMSDADFAKILKKMTKDQERALLGD